MATRTNAFVKNQYGVEATPGAGGSATTVLSSLKITPTPKSETKEVTAVGTIAPLAVPLVKDYTEAKIEKASDLPCYEDLPFILGSAIAKVNLGAYTLDIDSPNTADTYAVEIGDAVNCESFSYAAVSGFTFKWSRDEVDLSGEMIGGTLDNTGTWSVTTPPTSITPICPTHVTVKIDSVTVSECDSLELTVSDRWKAKWNITSSSMSFSKLAESKPTINLKMEVEANTTGHAHLERLRAGNATATVEITMTDGTKSCKFTIATKVKEPTEYKDLDGTVYGLGYTFVCVYVPTGTSFKAEYSAGI